jgi:alpha-galactosidase
VHGSFGVIAEMLGYEPGGLEVVSAGINHLNWLFDVREKGSGKSCLEEFLAKVADSKYWRERFPNVPPQKFTLEVLKTFDMYPIGYDDHITEYLPFFWEECEWAEHGYASVKSEYVRMSEKKATSTLEAIKLLGADYQHPPFPKDDGHPYYSEEPCRVIQALESNSPTYFDAIVVPNNGAVDNLPREAVLDVPALAIGGEVRSVHVGELPIGPMEICRRQVTLHEMVAKATVEGDEKLILQAFCLDPYVRSITQARAIWADFKKEYADDLPTFA